MTRQAGHGGDLLCDLLAHLGVDAAFGVVSVHNLPLVEALDRRLRFVPVRHEAAAVNAADAYARVRGPVGVAVTSTGTGAGNAAGSLIEALTAHSPVLHVTGQIPLAHLGAGRGVIHETPRQAEMLAAVSVWVGTVGVTGGAPDVLGRAVTEALSPPGGPASVEWPIDLQHAPAVGAPRPSPRRPDPPDPAAVTEAARVISAARRPLVWFGGGAVRAREAAARFVDRTGAVVLTSNAGRGTLDERDPRVVGNFASHPAVEPLLAEADLLVSVGTHFRSNETRDFRLALPRPHVQIDVDPAAVGRTYPADVGVVGDAAEVLDAIVAELADRPVDPRWLARGAAVRAAARSALRRAIGAQAVICDVLRRVLPAPAVIARDVTIPSSTWGNRLLAVHDPRTNVYARGGGIGQGLAMAVGAAVAGASPVACIVGDGGLMVHPGELATLRQLDAPVVVLVFNDRGYGVLRNLQDAHWGRRAGVDLWTPDMEALARAMDLPYRRVTDVRRFEDALRGALAASPAMVEVDVEAIGPMPRPFVPPVEMPGGAA